MGPAKLGAVIYLSKPNGTYGVFHSRTSQGAYAVHKLTPGTFPTKVVAYGYCGERDSLREACTLADARDADGYDG